MTSIVIRTVSAVDAIEYQLRQNILNSTWAPGEKIPSEKELGKLFDVSRLPTREAIARLTALGMPVPQGKGVFVESSVRESGLSDVLSPLFLGENPTRSRKLMETRAFLEGEIAAKAAVHLNPKAIEKLQSFLDIPSSAVASAEAFADFDQAFHTHLARMADNEFLYHLYHSLSPSIHKFLIEFGTNRKVRRSALERHEEIVLAVCKGQPEKARKAAHGHLIPCLDTHFGNLKTKVS